MQRDEMAALEGYRAIARQQGLGHPPPAVDTAVETAVAEAHRAHIGLVHDHIPKELAVRHQYPRVALQLVHLDGRVGHVGAGLRHQHIPRPRVRPRAAAADEMETDALAEGKAVTEVLPVGTSDDEGLAVRQHEGA